LVETLVTADTADVPRLVEQLPGYRHWADPLLLRHVQGSPEGTKAHLHASLALVPVVEGQVDFLYGRLLEAAPGELPVIRDALLPQGALKASRPDDALRERLWGVLLAREKDPDQRLREGCALAKDTADDPRWETVGGDLAAKLMTEDFLVVGKWLDALRSSAGHLLPPLAPHLEDEKRTVPEVLAAANIYGNLAEGRPDAFASLE